MKIEQGTESPRQGNAENDPRRGDCGKPYDGRNDEYQRKTAGGKTIQPPAGAAAEKVVQHIGAEIERHAAKGAEKKALDATQPKTHSSRLQFSEAERATPELQKAIKKSDKAADCLDAARAAIPQADQKSRKSAFLTKRKARQRRAFPLKRRISPQTASCVITRYPVRRRNWTPPYMEKSMRWRKKTSVWKADTG